MVLVGFFCVLGALGLLVAGLVQSDPQLVWASMGASGVGGVAVAVASIQRNRALRRLKASAAPAPAAPSATQSVASGPEAREAAAKPSAAQDPVIDKPVAVALVAEEPERIHKHAVRDQLVTRAAPTTPLAVTPRPEPPAPEVPGAGVAGEADSGQPVRAPGAGDSDPEGHLGDTEMIDLVDEAVDPVDEPAEEDVDMADLLIVIDLTDEVLVVDLRPRYHRAGCGHLTGRTAIPVPVSEAREDGFTPCGLCQPDAALAAAGREARTGAADRPGRERPRPGI